MQLTLSAELIIDTGTISRFSVCRSVLGLPMSPRLPSIPIRPVSQRIPTPVPARLTALTATKSSTLVSDVMSPEGNSVVKAGGSVILSNARKKRLHCGNDPAVDMDTSSWSERDEDAEQKVEKAPNGGDMLSPIK